MFSKIFSYFFSVVASLSMGFADFVSWRTVKKDKPVAVTVNIKNTQLEKKQAVSRQFFGGITHLAFDWIDRLNNIFNDAQSENRVYLWHKKHAEKERVARVKEIAELKKQSITSSSPFMKKDIKEKIDLEVLEKPVCLKKGRGHSYTGLEHFVPRASSDKKITGEFNSYRGEFVGDKVDYCPTKNFGGSKFLGTENLVTLKLGIEKGFFGTGANLYNNDFLSERVSLNKKITDECNNYSGEFVGNKVDYCPTKKLFDDHKFSGIELLVPRKAFVSGRFGTGASFYNNDWLGVYNSFVLLEKPGGSNLFNKNYFLQKYNLFQLSDIGAPSEYSGEFIGSKIDYCPKVVIKKHKFSGFEFPQLPKKVSGEQRIFDIRATSVGIKQVELELKDVRKDKIASDLLFLRKIFKQIYTDLEVAQKSRKYSSNSNRLEKFKYKSGDINLKNKKDSLDQLIGLVEGGIKAFVKQLEHVGIDKKGKVWKRQNTDFVFDGDEQIVDKEKNRKACENLKKLQLLLKKIKKEAISLKKKSLWQRPKLKKDFDDKNIIDHKKRNIALKRLKKLIRSVDRLEELYYVATGKAFGSGRIVKRWNPLVGFELNSHKANKLKFDIKPTLQKTGLTDTHPNKLVIKSRKKLEHKNIQAREIARELQAIKPNAESKEKLKTALQEILLKQLKENGSIGQLEEVEKFENLLGFVLLKNRKKHEELIKKGLISTASCLHMLDKKPVTINSATGVCVSSDAGTRLSKKEKIKLLKETIKLNSQLALKYIEQDNKRIELRAKYSKTMKKVFEEICSGKRADKMAQQRKNRSNKQFAQQVQRILVTQDIVQKKLTEAVIMRAIQMYLCIHVIAGSSSQKKLKNYLGFGKGFLNLFKTRTREAFGQVFSLVGCFLQGLKSTELVVKNPEVEHKVIDFKVNAIYEINQTNLLGNTNQVVIPKVNNSNKFARLFSMFKKIKQVKL